MGIGGRHQREGKRKRKESSSGFSTMFDPVQMPQKEEKKRRTAGNRQSSSTPAASRGGKGGGGKTSSARAKIACVNICSREADREGNGRGRGKGENPPRMSTASDSIKPSRIKREEKKKEHHGSIVEQIAPFINLN